MALDPKEYAKYDQTMSVDIKGIDIVWADVPEKEMMRILPIIDGVAKALRKVYRVTFKPSETYIHLVADFKTAPDQADVLILKSIGSGLLAATSWGGP